MIEFSWTHFHFNKSLRDVAYWKHICHSHVHHLLSLIVYHRQWHISQLQKMHFSIHWLQFNFVIISFWLMSYWIILVFSFEANYNSIDKFIVLRFLIYSIYNSLSLKEWILLYYNVTTYSWIKSFKQWRIVSFDFRLLKLFPRNYETINEP